MPARKRTTKFTKKLESFPWYRKVQKRLKTPLFSKLYVAFSLAVVLATTLYWSILGAKVQLGNADQLVNADLFKTLAVLRQATLPSAHTFLLKWPIFWLIQIFGSTSSVINVFTVGLVIVTVMSLVAIIHRIERRPIVFGTICLALASVLLLIPAEPYAGALLPVNMAMVATRNIEYIIFILSLVVLIRSPRLKSWSFWLSAVCLSVLIASDKLFLFFMVGGALIALFIHGATRAWTLVTLAVQWLVLSAVAALGATAILAIISSSGLTHLSSQSSVGPYNLSGNLTHIVLGCIYAFMGLLTNFGANPAFDAIKVRSIPHQFLARLLSLSGPAYAINLLLLATGLFVLYRVMRSTLRAYKIKRKLTLNKATLLSIMLVWSSLAALVSFIATDHYYAVDARYLTILLFTVFITTAAYTRSRKWRPEFLVSIGFVIVIGILFGLIGATRNYHDETQALAPQNSRNQAVAQILTQHRVDVLVGDYWRVVPISQVAGNKLNVLPLANCTQIRQILSSAAWQPDLHKADFAYLLTLHGSLTDFPNCTLKQAIGAYGKPNASTLVSGTFNQPNEVVLFYDRGIRKSAPVLPSSSKTAATVVPISLGDLPHTSCSVPSVMNIVAHEDDDLLFMNPDLYTEIQAGDCIRTVYVTAGNAGAGEFYWLSRQEGSEAAYSYMLHTNDIWIQRIVELSPHEYITVANPKGNSKVSLIFMNLPDGNLKGQGFSSSNFESLVKLQQGKINVMNTVDNQSYYSSPQLISALSTLLNAYQTTNVNTQAGVVGQQFPDHSDHLAVNWYVKQAYQQYETQRFDNQITIPLKFYIGYPIREQPANVTGTALQEKEAIFLAYAKYDAAVCQTLPMCVQTPTYNGYLNREYQSTY